MASRAERLSLAAAYAVVALVVLLLGRRSMEPPVDPPGPHVLDDSMALSERTGHFTPNIAPLAVAPPPPPPQGLSAAPRNRSGDGVYLAYGSIRSPNVAQEAESEVEKLLVTPDEIQLGGMFIANGSPIASVSCTYMRPHGALVFRADGSCTATTDQPLNGEAAWSFDPASDTWSTTSEAGVVRVYNELYK